MCSNNTSQESTIALPWHTVNKVGTLKEENARLKARLMNIEEGLKRLETYLKDHSRLSYVTTWIKGVEPAFELENYDYELISSGETLADLIDNILIEQP